MTKLSPARLQGIMMGMWFLASAYGQYVAGLIGAGMAQRLKENAGPAESLMTYTEGYKDVGYLCINCRCGTDFDITIGEKIDAGSALIYS